MDKKEQMIAFSKAVLAETEMTDEKLQSYMKQMSEILDED